MLYWVLIVRWIDVDEGIGFINVTVFLGYFYFINIAN